MDCGTEGSCSVADCEHFAEDGLGCGVDVDGFSSVVCGGDLTAGLDCGVGNGGLGSGTTVERGRWEETWLGLECGHLAGNRGSEPVESGEPAPDSFASFSTSAPRAETSFR